MKNIYLHFESDIKRGSRFIFTYFLELKYNESVCKRIISSQAKFKYNKTIFVLNELYRFFKLCELNKYTGDINIIHNATMLQELLNTRQSTAFGYLKTILRKILYLNTQGYNFKFIFNPNLSYEKTHEICYDNAF